MTPRFPIVVRKSLSIRTPYGGTSTGIRRRVRRLREDGA